MADTKQDISPVNSNCGFPGSCSLVPQLAQLILYIGQLNKMCLSQKRNGTFGYLYSNITGVLIQLILYIWLFEKNNLCSSGQTCIFVYLSYFCLLSYICTLGQFCNYRSCFLFSFVSFSHMELSASLACPPLSLELCANLLRLDGIINAYCSIFLLSFLRFSF